MTCAIDQKMLEFVRCFSSWRRLMVMFAYNGQKWEIFVHKYVLCWFGLPLGRRFCSTARTIIPLYNAYLLC
jgi:hypothetical protein